MFGAAIHRAIAHHFRQLRCGAPAPALADLLAHYQAEWGERDDRQVSFSAAESRQTIDDTARRLLTVFQASDLARPGGTILAVEAELRGPLLSGLPDLLGIVDLVVETPSALVIYDWKTARARWSEFQVDAAFEQLLLYAELTRDLAPHKPRELELVVLTKTKAAAIDRHSRPAERGQLDRQKRLIGSIWRAMEGEHFYPTPSPLACGGCPFRQPCRNWPG